MRVPRKLVEVAIPLETINAASALEKGNPFLKGHPRTLHPWWARRPLAAARAVLFAQLVNDPGHGRATAGGVDARAAALERERLFGIMRRLVQWESMNDPQVLAEARDEIRKSWRETCELNKDHPDAATLFDPDVLPPFHDPFAGGGTIPLEAQRLGLDVGASDLNPVAVLINQALLAFAPRFEGRPPVRADARLSARPWRGSEGLAADVRAYGRWLRDEAERRIGDLYPAVEVTPEMADGRPDLTRLVGTRLRIVSWIWARTVRCPNPAFSHVEVPLVTTFRLAGKAGREAYIDLRMTRDGYRVHVANL